MKLIPFHIISIGNAIIDFKQTVAQYLKSNHSATITYSPKIDKSTFNCQVVDNNGTMCSFKSFDINDSTTIGDICADFESECTQVVKIKNGLIHQIVAPSTKIIDLIHDGYSYRIDQYEHTVIKTDKDYVTVCVIFVGDSPPEQQRTPLLINLPSGSHMYDIGYQVIHILGGYCTHKALRNFQYRVDGKSVDKRSVLVKSDNPEVIQIVSLDMNE